MRQSHVRMMLVVNSENRFIGIVTSHDVGEQQIIQRVSELKVKREELTVHDFMRPKTSLMSFDFSELIRSSVGDVIETLKDYGQHHCLVMDRDSHEIRGVISVSDIARELRLPLDIQGRPTFAELINIYCIFGIYTISYIGNLFATSINALFGNAWAFFNRQTIRI